MYFGVEQYEVLNVNHIKGVHPENRVIGFVLLAIRPAELGKTTNTTFTTSNNLHASRVLQSCCKVNNKIQGFARTLRQEKSAGNVCPRQALFIVVSLAATLGQHRPRRGDVPAKLFHSWHSFSPWHNLSKFSSAHGLPKELLLVVKVVQVVFHVSTSNHSIFEKNLFYIECGEKRSV